MTRASTILFWFSLTIVVSLGLYHTSYRVEELGRTLRSLNAQIEMEQRNIHVLKAEYVYLTDPSRIEAAARKHLALQPTEPKQIAKMTKLAALVPARGEPATALAAAPEARVHPAAATPRPAAEEAGRVNTHLNMRKTASAEPTLARTLALAPAASAATVTDDSDDSGDDQ